MAENNTQPTVADASANPDIEYERTDVHLRPIALTAAGMAVLLLIAPLALLYGFPKLGADVNRNIRVIPPQPRLQTDPASDLVAQLSRQRAVLESYAWIDRKRGITRVPIAVAMKHVLQQGIDGFPSKPTETP